LQTAKPNILESVSLVCSSTKVAQFSTPNILLRMGSKVYITVSVQCINNTN